MARLNVSPGPVAPLVEGREPRRASGEAEEDWGAKTQRPRFARPFSFEE
jgi:hypothetical protein